MKRFALTLLSIAVFMAWGCVKKDPQQIRIGFLVKRPEEFWFQNEWKYAQKCADKYGFTLIKIGTPDGDKVLSAIDNLAALGAQGFVICTPDVRLGPSIKARADFHKMKVMSVDDQWVGPDGKFMEVPYMGISSKSIGRAVGKALVDEFSVRGWSLESTAALAVTFDELNTVKERTDAASEVLVESGFPEERIFRIPEKTIDLPGAFDAANIALSQHPEVAHWLIFSVNDEGVLGAIRAMENRGFTADTVIGIGIGAGAGIREFAKPEITPFFGFCIINPYRHGFETTEMVYNWIKFGRRPPMDTRTPGVIVTRENYKQAFKDLGMGDLIEPQPGQEAF
ncbi:MAG: substrate-binding domain-containing protein [Spirochaetales bacterium]|nr:substrate-binding domain-containing protein [Spirochaetales bacterium]